MVKISEKNPEIFFQSFDVQEAVNNAMAQFKRIPRDSAVAMSTEMCGFENK
jgi:hypothetical protein